MTPLYLQDELVEEIKSITSDLYFENSLGEKTQMNVYPQSLPIKQNDEESEPFPYGIVRLNSGEASGVQSDDSNIRVILIIGIRNSKAENQGHSDVLGVIQKIAERFLKNNILKNFAQTGTIEWTLQDEESYPYFFGGMDLKFQSMMNIGRENKYI